MERKFWWNDNKRKNLEVIYIEPFYCTIFGKVKAGKSTLGNFIAKHRLDSQKVDFFKYDETRVKTIYKN